MTRWIDLRSDTLTKPTVEMRRAIASAVVGDDVYGEDPTVNRLEQMVAEFTGMEAAVFCASGTQSNLVALLSHCQRGDEYIVGQQAHTYKYEGGGAAVLGSIQPQPLDFEADGSLDLDKVEMAIKADDVHFAKSRLLALENTQSGKVIPIPYIKNASEFARRKGLSLHLDGARICNAAVALDVPVADITGYFDSVSICMSKGLGAPVGSLLCGEKALVEEARRWRKVLGGGMRQAGMLAAAAIFALEHNIPRLAEDHENAAKLADGLKSIEEVKVLYGSTSTNMVFIELPAGHEEPLVRYAMTRGIRMAAHNPLRLVVHLGIQSADVETTIKVVSEYFRLR